MKNNYDSIYANMFVAKGSQGQLGTNGGRLVATYSEDGTWVFGRQGSSYTHKAYCSNFVIQDPNTGDVGTAGAAYVQFSDGAGTRMGWVGFGSGGNDIMAIVNDTGIVEIQGDNKTGLTVDTNGLALLGRQGSGLQLTHTSRGRVFEIKDSDTSVSGDSSRCYLLFSSSDGVQKSWIGHVYADTNLYINHSRTTGGIKFRINHVEKGDIDSNGNWTLGPGTTYHKFKANSAGSYTIVLIDTDSSNPGIAFNNNADSTIASLLCSSSHLWLYNKIAGSIIFGTNNSQKGSIDSSGKWTFGETNGTQTHVMHGVLSCGDIDGGGQLGTGSAGLRIRKQTNSNTDFIHFAGSQDAIDQFGGIRRLGTGTICDFYDGSDRRIKSNIAPMGSVLDKICQVNLCTFNVGESVGQGPIAQELIEIFPDKVVATDDGTGEMLPEGTSPWSITRSWDYELIKCIQELKAKNDALETRLEALEA